MTQHRSGWITSLLGQTSSTSSRSICHCYRGRFLLAVFNLSRLWLVWKWDLKPLASLTGRHWEAQDQQQAHWSSASCTSVWAVEASALHLKHQHFYNHCKNPSERYLLGLEFNSRLEFLLGLTGARRCIRVNRVLPKTGALDFFSSWRYWRCFEQ